MNIRSQGNEEKLPPTPAFLEPNESLAKFFRDHDLLAITDDEHPLRGKYMLRGNSDSSSDSENDTFRSRALISHTIRSRLISLNYSKFLLRGCSGYMKGLIQKISYERPILQELNLNAPIVNPENRFIQFEAKNETIDVYCARIYKEFSEIIDPIHKKFVATRKAFEKSTTVDNFKLLLESLDNVSSEAYICSHNVILQLKKLQSQKAPMTMLLETFGCIKKSNPGPDKTIYPALIALSASLSKIANQSGGCLAEILIIIDNNRERPASPAP